MSDHSYPEWPTDRQRAEAKEGEIERLDAVIAKLKARLADRERRIRLAGELLRGSIRRDVQDVLDLRRALPKTAGKR